MLIPIYECSENPARGKSKRELSEMFEDPIVSQTLKMWFKKKASMPRGGSPKPLAALPP